MKWLNGYRMRFFVVFVAAVVLCGGSAKADFTWTQKADMPTPRWGHTSAVVNDKIYVIGGGSSESNFRMLSTVEEYDPATDTWTRRVDMPTARGWMSPSSAVVDEKIYVIGGDGYTLGILPTVEEYDPSTNTWARKADMPTQRWGLATCTVNGKIYAIGGTYPGGGGRLKTVEEYDPVTDTWTSRADMPVGVFLLCANVVKGKIYAIGGRPALKAGPYVQEYNPATDTWTRIDGMPVATSQMASVVLDDKIIVIGGWLISNQYPYTTVQMYDPEMNIWTSGADVPFLRACFSADVVNNRIYAIGGTDRPHPCPATSTVFEFGWNQKPTDGSATDVQNALPLSWKPGYEVILYEVYLGTDRDAVEDADISDTTGIYRGQQDANSYMPPEDLESGQTYYWRIDEIRLGGNAKKGEVWSFTIIGYLFVDDFEQYTDTEPDTIYLTWEDGWNDPTNGATAGYSFPDLIGGEHYMEDMIVHSGNWSMPLFYNNSVGLSEVTRTLNADWTVGDVATLGLYYYGDPANAPEPMFIAVDNAVATNDDANAALVTEWTLWMIPLQQLVDQGVTLTNVGSMSIGFGRANPVAGGEGHVFFDDIALHLPTEQ